ncbi:MAG: tRNA-guanine transglycosylase, partial [Clostridia bacterium]|nr:tRNA-guanine transglycosylase [Clostridia bacterium]
MPSRNARHGHVFTSEGIRNLNNSKYTLDKEPIDPKCGCPTCRNHSRGYIHHLIKSGELLAGRLTVMHNLYFYNNLMTQIRSALEQDRFEQLYNELMPTIATRI